MSGPGTDSRAVPEGFTRVRLDLSYDGTGFSGWARQPGRETIQQRIEDALSEICGRHTAVYCAGRTDAGVHARGQVAHSDLPDESLQRRTWHGLTAQLNRLIGPQIRCRRVEPAPPHFDARFAAQSRHYVYRICDVAEQRDPLTRHWVLFHPRHLDTDAMAVAAQSLLGEHDFAAFCRAREGATTIRRLDYATVHRDANDLIEIALGADAFCHSMVRSVVGALVAVGEGRRAPRWVAAVLAAGQRDSAAGVVSARGLVLERVEYPPDNGLASRVRESRQLRQLKPEAD